MNNLFTVLIVFVTVLIFACQKEINPEILGTPADGSLQKDGGGLCLPKTIHGTYVAGTALSSTNTMDVSVNVAATGSYTISTNTVNGYSFKGTGSFTSTGIQIVNLKGTGQPVTGGNNVFTVLFDSTQCNVTVAVLPAGAGGPAVFTLAGAGGNCTTPVITGSYIIGTALNSGNTVKLSVNVTTIGNYNVTTAAVNGMTFSSGNAAFTATGQQTITLTGSGTPSGTPGSVSIPVTAGTSTCNFQITTTTGGSYVVNCSTANVNGTYEAGTALDPMTNTVDIDVNVTTAGPYNIATTLNNGMTFNASGTFSTTGVQTIQLAGNGTPSLGGTYNISVPGSTPCTFPVIVDGPATIDWKFTQGTTTYQGETDNAQLQSLPPTFTSFHYTGSNVNETFIFSLVDIAGGINTNETYNTISTTSNTGAFIFNFSGGDIWTADPQTPGTSVIFTITSHNTSTKTVTGTFSGTVKNSAGTPLAITNGTFTATYP